MFRLAVVLGIDRDFGCVNRNLFCRRSVEYIDGDCPGIFIVEILDDSITALDGEFNKKIYIFIQVKKNISHDAMIVLFRPHPPVRPAAEH